MKMRPFTSMKQKKFVCKHYSFTLFVPKQIELFIVVADIDKKELFNKHFWSTIIEDSIFSCHERHPFDLDFKKYAFGTPLTTAKHIGIIITGCYLHSKKIFELDTVELELPKNNILSSSTNLPSGWRIYYSVIALD